MADDDRVRSTVRLPQDAYDALCAELPSFSTDTARYQFLVQFYLDYKQQITAPGNQPECRTGPHMAPNTPAHGEEHQSAHEQPSEHPSEADTDEASPPMNSENEPSTQPNQQDGTDNQQSSNTEPTTTER